MMNSAHSSDNKYFVMILGTGVLLSRWNGMQIMLHKVNTCTKIG